jgi:hypothetical protein
VIAEDGAYGTWVGRVVGGRGRPRLGQRRPEHDAEQGGRERIDRKQHTIAVGCKDASEECRN